MPCRPMLPLELGDVNRKDVPSAPALTPRPPRLDGIRFAFTKPITVKSMSGSRRRRSIDDCSLVFTLPYIPIFQFPCVLELFNRGARGPMFTFAFWQCYRNHEDVFQKPQRIAHPPPTPSSCSGFRVRVEAPDA